ncbi:hypothetical protein LCGC14_3122540, partial [marine sediment metagenome]
MSMMTDIKAHVKDWQDEEEISAYLAKLLRKEAFDHSGLIYGIGHAVYTYSDPRALLLQEKAGELAAEKGLQKDFELYQKVARLAPEVFKHEKKSDKTISANVDFYSGFVYHLLNIPIALYTPIFAVARIAGWSAHRIEELISGGRIIRPAYRNVLPRRGYVPIEQR